MAELKYTVIRTKEQYFEYCDLLEKLVFSDDDTKEEEIDLLDVLIEKWDNEQKYFKELDPIDLLKYLMEENGLKAKDLTSILGLSKGTISKMLNCQSRLSRESIKILAGYFKLSQEAFNRDYSLSKPKTQVIHS